MLSIKRCGPPDVLQTNGEVWTIEYVAAEGPTERSKKERWRHPQIKEALKDLSNGKCAYCEATIGDVAFAHVDHFAPKVSYPELAHTWTNLVFCCPLCNNEKRDFFDLEQGILNPYSDDVDLDLVHHGDLVHWKIGSARGEITVRKLALNRYDLASRRRERIENVLSLLDRWDKAEGPLKELLAEAILDDAVKGEFTASVFSVFRLLEFPRIDKLA